ncbi:hypothetical protein, partial [Parabacteroides distasonis]|uniref:hypothetical protein n=1 Tax=Parabacteroides distasonis TaxID=823 RepID=UPI001F3EA8DB
SVYEVPLAVVAVVILPVACQPSAAVIRPVPSAFAAVQVSHLVGCAEYALVHGVVRPHEVAHSVVVEDDRLGREVAAHRHQPCAHVPPVASPSRMPFARMHVAGAYKPHVVIVRG